MKTRRLKRSSDRALNLQDAPFLLGKLGISVLIVILLECQCTVRGEAQLGAADWAPDNWAPCRLGSGQLRAKTGRRKNCLKVRLELGSVPVRVKTCCGPKTAPKWPAKRIRRHCQGIVK